ncbi:MAG: hypothetical protein Q8P52_01895 [bacterium]|nr:hypothetical protein [bacterium]
MGYTPARRSTTTTLGLGGEEGWGHSVHKSEKHSLPAQSMGRPKLKGKTMEKLNIFWFLVGGILFVSGIIFTVSICLAAKKIPPHK